ncbi:MAG: hypothetical protein KC635_25705, partial [Myxococcales bacterium]|nr:hypothetical protein [Myxococcales bacterium]
MPRLALTLVAALTATALAACGDSGSTSNGAVDSTTALDTAVEADTTEPSDTTAPDDADAGDTTAPGDAADAADTADTADTSAPTCAGDSDCTWCQYPTPPVFESDCYCLNCAQTVLDTTTCEANAAAWADVCSAWATSCPLAGFCPPPDNDPACMGGHCEDPCALVDCAAPDCPASEWVREPGQCCQTCRDPAACDENGDCGWCVYDKPVETQSDCYCRACPTAALATDVCSDYAAQWAANCPDGWDEASPCPVPRCAVPHDVACDPAEGSCVDACSLVTCPELACAPA